MAFDRWSAQIISADNEEAQRALLGEIGVYRAQHLTDIPALREAAFAVSRLQGLLGNHEESVREARSLLSLCQTTPVATREEIADAKAYLGSLGARPGPVKLASRPHQEPRRGKAPQQRTDPVDRALQLAVEGDTQGALKLLKGKRGRGDIARVWIKLTRALAAEGEDQVRQLEQLERTLRRALDVPAERKPKAERESEAPPRELEGALEHLLQAPLPRRRDAQVRLGETWLDANPGREDELAAVLLEDHLERSGAEAPAPWLASFVVRGWGQPRTTAAVEKLRAAGSVALQIYDEAPFARAVALYQAAPGRFSELRRGVLGRRDADEQRRLWTFRVDDRNKMLVLGPTVDSPWTEDQARAIAERLPHLCERIVLLAPGATNASLREAVAGAGYLTLDGEPSDTEIYGALDNASPIAAPKPRRDAKQAEPKSEKAAPKQAEPRKDAPRAEAKKAPAKKEAAEAVAKGPDPVEAFLKLLHGAEVATEEALEPVLRGVGKLRDVFLATTDAWKTVPEDGSARLAPILHVADRVAPAGLKVPEAVTLALRVAAAAGGPTLEALSGPVAERFAGPGIGEVVEIVAAAEKAGWSLRRAFLGTTRRERRNNAALQALEGSLDGLWRLEVTNGERRVELWYLAELPAEGRAAVPQLLLDEKERIVLLPIDPELSSWYASIDGPTALGWTGEDDALAEVLAERA